MFYMDTLSHVLHVMFFHIKAQHLYKMVIISLIEEKNSILSVQFLFFL